MKGQREIRVKRIEKSIFAIYTFLFILTSALVFCYFPANGKSFIWEADGLYQHFNAFVFYGQYLRGIVRNLMVNHSFVLPMHSFRIGYGGDIITTLSYYVVGDPFALLSALFPTKYAEIGYMVLILLRIYAAGLSFSLYAKKMNCSKTGTLCGALSYCFCGFALAASVRHPYFTNPMIWLPLIYLGIEKILRNEKPWLYIVSVFLAAISNFYFFYMIVLLVILYVLIRGGEYMSWNIADLLKFSLRIFMYSVIGVLLSACIFLPTTMAFLDCSRSDKSYIFDALYKLREYAALPGALISKTQACEWTFLGFTPVAVPTLICGVLRKSKEKWHKILLFFYLLFLLFPIFGYIFNGFAYVTNRWIFAVSFLVCFYLASNAEFLSKLTGKKYALLILLCILFALTVIMIEESGTKNAKAGLLVLFVALFLIRMFGNTKASSGILIFTTILGVIVNGYFKYSASEGSYITEFWDFGTALTRLEGGDCYAADLIDDPGFYRINSASAAISYNYNYPIYKDYKTTTVYWSMVPGLWRDYLQSNLAYEFTVNTSAGLESRAMLLPFFAAKYYTVNEDYAYQVPYGFHFVGKAPAEYGSWISLYQTENVLPLGFTYNSYIMEDEYLEQTPTQRQQTMLQAAVIKENEMLQEFTDVEHCTPSFNDADIPFAAIGNENVELSDHRIVTKEDNTSITLEGNYPANTELYFYITGVEFEQDLSETMTAITANAGSGESARNVHFPKKNIYVHGRHEYLLNLYYSEEPRNQITVTFSRVGEYTFDEMHVIAQPMDTLEDDLNDLREDQLENVSLTANAISGTIDLEEDKILCLSIPYSAGWKITVDGNPTDSFIVNQMFIGIPLSSGHHSIALQYTTPWLKEGILLSMLGATLWCLLWHHYIISGAGSSKYSPL